MIISKRYLVIKVSVDGNKSILTQGKIEMSKFRITFAISISITITISISIIT